MKRRRPSGLRSALASSAWITVLAIFASACGSSTRRESTPMVVHINGRATGDYVHETSATGTDFLVPASELATQGTSTFDIASPPAADSGMDVVGPTPSFTTETQTQNATKSWLVGPTVTGMTPERASVELLVTGDPGRRIYLSFEEACGFFHVGPAANGESVKNGAHGQRIMRTPAVMIVPMLKTKPENTCYVTGAVTTRGHNNLHLSLIDY